MKNAKRVIIPVVIVLVVLLALNSCKDTLGAVIDQATGKADTVQEEDTTQWAELTSDPLSLEGIGDPSAKYAAAAVNSCLNIVFNGIYSHDITSTLRGGVNAKVIYSSYEQYTSWALAVDLGLNYYNADNDLSLSLVARNLGGQIKRYNETFERMPFDLQLGYTQSLEHAPIRISVTARNLTRWKLPYPTIENSAYTGNSDIVEKSGFVDNLFRHLIFGVEFLPTDRLYFGVGYNYKTRTDMKTASRNFLSGFSIGGGIKVRMFGLGIALAQQHTGATTLMVNLSLNLFEFKK